ncbi:AbrB family transcriptional regulator [Solimonas marina]|uniref:AbrB family transcriptional regulator n=1 Tax=Solimonas marina TaxID=2714601 RepID=A0A969W8T1_9GAMM|nr:AbrB family transcriptional regulator [Solimonas marina]NKF22004.1 AbrB family transcriptional regulator [Solimonas marina]
MAEVGPEPSRRPTPGRYAALLAVTLPLTVALHLAGLPAAFLIGPLCAAIALAVRGRPVAVPNALYLAAQAMLGCMIAAAVTREVPASFRQGAPLLVVAVALPVLLSALQGYLLSRWRLLPATTGVWGSLPGAASAMVVMGEGFGGDPRLVAFMQYLRVLCVAIAASVIGLVFVQGPQHAHATVWFPALDPLALMVTLAIGGVGAWLGLRLRIPSGALLMPMAIGLIVHLGNLAPMQLPEWVLVGGYALLGWSIGARFTREALIYALRLLPQILGAIAVLLVFCGVLAWMVTLLLPIDPLTAYLALCPGGLDSATIIAASTHADLPLVVLLQTLRLMIVVIAGPALARLAATRAQAYLRRADAG